MDISIRQISAPTHELWQVQLDQHAVSFRNEQSARDFASKLSERLSAPHALPEGSGLMAADASGTA